MKISIFIILLLSLTSSSSDQTMWQTSYFSRPVLQKEDTWCVHACMEISLGIPQCVAVHDWLRYRDILLPVTIDCCGVITSDNLYFCVQNAGVPRSEITRFLSTNYTPIVGRYTTLWELLSYQDVLVAYLSLKYSLSYHLTVLYQVKEISENYYEIIYCDPEIGNMTQINNPNPLEIIY